MEDDSWDSIDYDQRITEEKQAKKKEKVVKNVNSNIEESEDGNYFEMNQAKKDLKQEMAAKSYQKTSQAYVSYFTPFSYKDLCEMRATGEEKFHELIFKTFGEIERYLMTHEEDLSDESLVELIKIDVAILQVPFTYHNRMLLQRLLQIESFWKQVVDMIKSFYEKNSKDPKYMLLIDTKGFFDSIKALVFYIIINNFFGSTKAMDVVRSLMSIEKFAEDGGDIFKGFSLDDLKSKKLITENAFEIYPTLSDLQKTPKDLEVNIINGEYSDVLHYLKVQLPLLKEDFLYKLRNGFNHLKNMKNDLSKHKVEKTPDVVITPLVKIHKTWHKVRNISCPLITANLNRRSEIFNGQLICFTTNKNYSNLIVATVLRNSQLEHLIPQKSIVIEIIRTENIDNIFDRDLIMIEPNSFFDPYCQVFNALKGLNEFNFPFKNRILKLSTDPGVPKYEQPDLISYQNQSFPLHSDWEKLSLGLENMQLVALKTAMCNDFNIIVGPPGSGKSFIGIEMVRLLLENTNEKILVITQTNNALDKFLIGCLKFTDKIARFGSQCKAKELSSYVVKHNMSQESKNYLHKLQTMQRDIVTNLIEKNSTPEEIFKEISFHYRLVEEINQLDNYQNTCSKRIFGMTTSLAAHNSSLAKLLKPGVVIIEEASEILEGHIVSSLSKETSHVIMIGDHHQLRPQTNSFDLQKKFNFNISLYERLIMNNYPSTTLDVQMRMRPEFCDLIRETVYTNLKDGACVMNYPNVKGISTNFFFFNHTHPENASETSKENSYEVDLILSFYKKLLSYGNNSNDITILTPYAAQAKDFKSKLNNLKLPNARVAVLDSYQGEESEIILLSLVRSNSNHDIGFLSIKNRVNVLLSRARIGFYIFGNLECFSAASTVWKKTGEVLARHDAIISEIPNDYFTSRTRLTSKN